MLALAVAIAATILLTPVSAQQGNYTVWSSVILTRTGERTPEVLLTEDTKLTPTGANSAFAAGTYFRNRYIVWENGTIGLWDAGAPLPGLDPDIFHSDEVYAMALDEQWNYATAQAFLQGFYPPTPNTNETSDLSSWLFNGSSLSYVTGPLGGYQYPKIHTPVPGIDPQYIDLDAGSGCDSWYKAREKAVYTQQANATLEATRDVYSYVGNRFLGSVLPDSQFWTSENAYAIYDYIRYIYLHDSSVQRQLDIVVEGTNSSYLDTLKNLADQQLYSWYGDESAYNTATRSTGLPGGIPGSISTISGNYFATKVYNTLADAAHGTDAYTRLSLFFADLATFMSIFALTGLPQQSPNFYGMPNFGASLVFELWSFANSSNATVPDADDLHVRFMFRNGTDADDEMTAYSLFDRPNEEFDMSWSDFSSLMGGIRLAGSDKWCTLCGTSGSEVAFCAADDAKHSKKHSSLSPVVAGVVGAVVALAVAALLFGAAMLIGGVRLHRNSRRKSDFGGFKGGQKMASDQDLTIPKGGAMVGATIERRGHERTGSWELTKPAKDLDDGEDLPSVRPSMEQVRPVQPHERV